MAQLRRKDKGLDLEETFKRSRAVLRPEGRALVRGRATEREVGCHGQHGRVRHDHLGGLGGSPVR